MLGRRKSHLASLTGLRFLAALHVVVFHLGYALYTSAPRPIRNVAESGYVGVSLFFVLSGFILAYNYLDVRGCLAVSRRAFWSARVARIYPVYLFGLLLYAPFFLQWCVQKLSEDGAVMGLAKSLVVALANVTLLQAWSPATVAQWNFPGWSLSVEAFFYTAFPFLVGAFALRSPRSLVRFAVAAWLLSLVGPLVYMATNPDGLRVVDHAAVGFWLTVMKYNPLLRLPEFMMGIAAGRLFVAGEGRRWHAALESPWMSVAATAAILGVLAIGPALPYPLMHNSLLAPLYALLIVSLAGGRGPVASLLALPAVVLLGEASYALYILHIPLAQLLRAVSGPLGIDRLGGVEYFALYLAIAIGASIWTVRRIEFPMRGRVRRWLERVLPREQVVEPVAPPPVLTSRGAS